MTFFKKIYYRYIERQLCGCKKVLDLGCGRSSVLTKIRKIYSVGVDACEPYLEESRQKGIHDEYLLSDFAELAFSDNSFDAIICFEVIEHIEKEQGLALIEKMKHWANIILITTPNGFLPSEEEYLHGEAINPELMRHKSGWTPREFRNLGFKVRGMGGIMAFSPNKNPNFIGRFLWYLSFPIVFFIPSLSGQLLAVRKA